MAPRAHRGRRGILGDERRRARRAADHDVGIGQLLVESAQVDRIGLDLGSPAIAPAQGAIRDDHALDARAGEMARGERDHLAGADHQRGVIAQIRVHAPREADGRRRERDRVGADLSLGAHALGGGKGGLKQLVEPGAGAAGLVRDPVGVLQLTQNLRLAEHHGVESRGDAEGMIDRESILMHVQARGEVQVIAVMTLEPSGTDSIRARVARPVHFRAIAGRQNHHLGDAAFLPQRAQSGDQAILVERHFLAQGDRRGLMVEPENVECHGSALTCNRQILVKKPR